MAAAAEDYEEDYEEYYDDDEEGVSGFVVLVVAVVVLVVFSAVVWFAYQRGIQEGSTPVIAANPEPIKTEQPVEFADASSSRQEVYDTLEGNTPTEVVVDTGSDRDPLEGFTQTTSASDEVIRVEVQAEPAAASLPTTTGADNSVAGNAIDLAVENDPAPAPAKPQVNRPAPVPVTKAQITAVGSAIAGSHVVQVGAFRSDEEAQGYFDKMKRDFGNLVGEKAPDVQRADLGQRGIFYRLRIGPFNSKDLASGYCAQLKQRGQDCLVKPV